MILFARSEAKLINDDSTKFSFSPRKTKKALKRSNKADRKKTAQFGQLKDLDKHHSMKKRQSTSKQLLNQSQQVSLSAGPPSNNLGLMKSKTHALLETT